VSRLAYVGTDRQVHLIDPDGRNDVRLSTPLPVEGNAPWGMLHPPREAYSWPSWSPDGAWVAAFCSAEKDDDAGPVRIVALGVDGVHVEEWARVEDGTPVYLQWNPTSDALGVLAQEGSQLTLRVVARARLGRLRELESGTPLFFAWSPDGRLLVHVGHAEGASQLVLRDPLGPRADVVYPSVPGSFCAPVFAGSRPVYAVADEEGWSTVVVSRIDGGSTRVLARHPGLLAIMPAPGGLPWVAVSAAQRGEGTSYDGIDVIHVETGETRRVTDAACMAFSWSPHGDAVFYAVVDSPENGVTWWRAAADGSGRMRLGTSWPTRDMLFYLHFFDQYVVSHPLTSPDGRWMVWAGYPAGAGQADLSVPPRIWVRDLHAPEEPPRAIAEGTFAVFPPAHVLATAPSETPLAWQEVPEAR
jgi:Tol biopolymer transport system component